MLAGFPYDLLRTGTDARSAVAGLGPALPGNGAVFLSVGIAGATVMPHVVYLHSALTSARIRCRGDDDRATVLRYGRIGDSSSSVGTFAGQAVMEGFLKLRGSVLARRAIAMIPALAVLAAGAGTVLSRRRSSRWGALVRKVLAADGDQGNDG